MRKFLVLFSFVPILLISFFSLGAMTLQQNHKSQQTTEKVRTKRSAETGINETDFINTMFLRSTFFENWSETNYFINPTLKTSQTLTYNDKWYLDFLKDIYSTGVSYDKPSDKFMDLYKNWDTYAKQYNIDKFYDVDKKQFLRELTNFSYSFAKYFNTVEIINKLEKNVDNLQIVNLVHQNWKLVNGFINEKNNDSKKYIGIVKIENGWKIIKWTGKNIEWKYQYKAIYRWDRLNEPNLPEIDNNTGKILKWNEKIDLFSLFLY
ncbi:spiroplasma phage ORF1-like family protein [Spiroplasma endosymbiont of Sarcophaga carnaria]|uniref:spiroplasma phage ORF1-like family protein n=1 Tax=Spiroplasma endosymbiont of Sarcophaga carnaria TaxID=3066303 RepID=UPI0030CF1483